MASRKLSTQAVNAKNQTYLFLLMRLDAAPLDAEGNAGVHDAESTLNFGADTSEVATLGVYGPTPKAAFESTFARFATDDDSNLWAFVDDEFEDERPIFVWLFDPTSKGWMYQGTITKNTTVSFELVA
jgi:hypothetical protein